jgi:hypothetical protein
MFGYIIPPKDPDSVWVVRLTPTFAGTDVAIAGWLKA